MNVEEINKDVEKFYRVSLKAKVLEDYGNYVGRALGEKVEKLRTLMPMISDLRSSSLKERH